MSLALQAIWQQGDFRLSIDSTLPVNGITALFGRSGCGKSSLLRLIAGLTKIPNASVYFQQQCWQDRRLFVPLAQRRIGLVFQQPGLLPHLSVQQNLLYGFQRAAPALRRLQPELVQDLLDLQPLFKQAVSTLSGGQQQRLALGRALLASPQLLLLDEPFAGLDNQSKAEILPFIRELVQHTGIPMLFVSHDTREVEKLADQLVLMADGQLQQQFSMQQALAQPDSPLFVDADAASVFFGVSGSADAFGRVPVYSNVATTDCKLWLGHCNFATGTELRLRILAKDVSLALTPISDISIQNQLPATIQAILPHHGNLLVHLTLADGQLLLSEITPYAAVQLRLTVGMQLTTLIKALALS
jgi:molybdate transport system ATP-binding protein